ncbi:MAG: ABC transporter substrate-binding protein [Gammaproteobacteria bacterium]|nr:ABC transporter substrate-binding protein [Gammaproteobacteria bacterium]
MRRKLCFLAIFLLPALSVTSPAQEIDKPEDVILGTVDSVIARINAEREMLEAQPETVYDLINDLIIPVFDFNNMSRWILGKYWKEASEEQRATFTSEFKALLVRTYAKAVLGFSNERVTYLETLTGSKPNIVMVKTEIVSDGSVTPVNYTMHISDGSWKVVNVAFEGISLVETYRKSFASEIRNNGLETLLQKLVDKNEKLEQSLLTDEA